MILLTLVFTLATLQVLRSDGRGWGLKSPDTIKKGEFVVEYVGELISMAEYRRRMAVNQEEKEENYYYLSIDSNRYVGNIFLNHKYTTILHIWEEPGRTGKG